MTAVLEQPGTKSVSAEPAATSHPDYLAMSAEAGAAVMAHIEQTHREPPEIARAWKAMFGKMMAETATALAAVQ